MHGVSFNMNGQHRLDERQLGEHLKSLQIDQYNIAKLIADNVGKETKEVEDHMNERTTLNPEEASEYGLVHEIKSEIVPANSDLSVIFEPSNAPQIQLPFNPQIIKGETTPLIESYSQSIDLQIGSNSY